MATAQPTVTERITRTVQKDGLVLSLSHAEANTLRTLLGSVGGCPDTSPMKYSNSILLAFNDAGYGEALHRVFNYSIAHGPLIYFADGTRALVEVQ